jgi:ABC-type multidrug transport system fused ATPase/permease subunit
LNSPRLFEGARRWLFLALLGVGLLEAGAAAWTAQQIGETARAARISPDAILRVVGGFVAMGLGLLAARWIGEVLAQSLVRDVRSRLFERSLRVVGSVEESRLLTPFVGDLAAIRNWAARGPAAMVASGAALAGTSVLLAARDSSLMVCLLPLALGLLLIGLLAIPLRDAVAEQRRARGYITRFVMVRLRRSRGRARKADRVGLTRRGDRFSMASVRRAQITGATEAIAVIAGGAAAVLVLLISADAALITGLSLVGFMASRLMAFNRGGHALIGGQVAMRAVRARLRAPRKSELQRQPERSEELS